MSCAIAILSLPMSPVFSPSRVSSSFFCEPSTSSSSSNGLLKMHRPPRLNIPVDSSKFAEVEAPLTRSEVMGRKEMEIENEEFSVYCKKGRRVALEDRFSATIGLQGDPKQAFFGVYDGHGGAEAAEFAAKNMEKNIMNEVIKKGREEIKEAVKSGYLLTDSEFLKQDLPGGSCCVTALIQNGDLVVSNAGDCRAVISKGGVSEAITSDHRPSREDERERVQSLGGYVDYCHGGWRLQGSLAVSRGIGDRHLKQWVIADPDTKILKLNPDSEFLILASDGLWEKVSNQEAVDMIRFMCFDTNKQPLLSACKKLAELAISRGSADDVTVMVIKLGIFI